MHLVCRCTRWQVAKVVPNKEADTLIGTIDECWVSVHGPMQELIIDGEKGVSSVVGMAYCFEKGIKRNIGGVGQPARFVERRGALMRDILHRCDEKLLAEGITDTPIVLRVGEAVFVGNALISVNNSTPYNALYGSVPNFLPDLPAFPDAELQ